MSDIFRDWSFGGVLRDLRVEKKLTLRMASKKVGMDSGNYSKLERSHIAPPRTKKEIVDMCKKLSIKGAEGFLCDLAYTFHQGKLHESFWGEDK